MNDTLHTPEQLVTIRKIAVEFNREERGKPDSVIEFTCDSCSYAPKCRWVFDSYNMNGDCIVK